MKNSIYVIAGLLIIIWAIFVFGFHFTGFIHILLVLVAFIVLIRIVFNKQLSGK